jgi:hypothetical protein
MHACGRTRMVSENAVFLLVMVCGGTFIFKESPTKLFRMKRQQTLPLAALSALFIFLYSSCVKGLPPDRLQKEVEACPILVLDARDTTQSGTQAEFARYRIDYNRDGNPVDKIFTAGNFPVPLDLYFRYDRYGRLSDNVTTFAGESGSAVWHRYGYPNRHSITDTSFDYVGDIDSAEPPHFSGDTYLDIYQLDDRGRIIKVTDYQGLDSSFDITGPGSVQTFAYDAGGDKVRPGVTYDDKVNPYQTNSVWMLIYNDYSLHNPVNVPIGVGGLGGPVTISKYNAVGLPLKMDGGLNNFYLFNDFEGDQLQITYGCGSGPSKRE